MNVKNILLVDDDSVCIFLTRNILQRLGFVNNIQTALNGKQALEFFNECTAGSKYLPDVILLDLDMPVMGGFDFLETFRRLHSQDIAKVKIIIVSSSDNPDDIGRAKELGVNQFLTKPLQMESLRKVLEVQNGIPFSGIV